MPHVRGAVPGPNTRGGERDSGSALPGEHAAEGQASPPAPDAEPEKFYDPSEGESAMETNMPHRGGGDISIPGENS